MLNSDGYNEKDPEFLPLYIVVCTFMCSTTILFIDAISFVNQSLVCVLMCVDCVVLSLACAVFMLFAKCHVAV